MLLIEKITGVLHSQIIAGRYNAGWLKSLNFYPVSATTIPASYFISTRGNLYEMTQALSSPTLEIDELYYFDCVSNQYVTIDLKTTATTVLEDLCKREIIPICVVEHNYSKNQEFTNSLNKDYIYSLANCIITAERLFLIQKPVGANSYVYLFNQIFNTGAFSQDCTLKLVDYLNWNGSQNFTSYYNFNGLLTSHRVPYLNFPLRPSPEWMPNCLQYGFFVEGTTNWYTTATQTTQEILTYHIDFNTAFSAWDYRRNTTFTTTNFQRCILASPVTTCYYSLESVSGYTSRAVDITIGMDTTVIMPLAYANNAANGSVGRNSTLFCAAPLWENQQMVNSETNLSNHTYSTYKYISSVYNTSQVDTNPNDLGGMNVVSIALQLQ